MRTWPQCSVSKGSAYIAAGSFWLPLPPKLFPHINEGAYTIGVLAWFCRETEPIRSISLSIRLSTYHLTISRKIDLYFRNWLPRLSRSKSKICRVGLHPGDPGESCRLSPNAVSLLAEFLPTQGMSVWVYSGLHILDEAHPHHRE